MTKKEYILMFRNEEVLSFEVTFGERNGVLLLQELEHFDKAPNNISRCEEKQEKDRRLLYFFNSRAIPSTRYDYQDILDATSCRDGFELSFKGRGLSLTNHYWFKEKGEKLRYEDINFFSNKWDDRFGKAILKGDYKALKEADLNVPDIVISGWAAKAWVYENNQPMLCKLGIHKGQSEEALGEVLASKLGRRLLADEVLEYRLKEVDGHYASLSPCMIGLDEELIPVSGVLPEALKRECASLKADRDHTRAFLRKLMESGYEDICRLYTKILVLKTLIFANDFHLDNVSIIRNIHSGRVRMAPIYDLAGAYGGSESGRKLLSNANIGTLFIVFYTFGMIEPDWDYSWYDPSKLDGFEDEIRETLSKSDFYTEALIENIIWVYRHQKDYLNQVAKRN